MRRAPITLIALLLLAGPVSADTIVLKTGKKIDGVVASDRGDHWVINRFNSRDADMTWGIEDKDRIPAAKVAEVIRSDPPLVEYHERASALRLTVDDHLELAAFCGQHKFKEERLRHLVQALTLDPENVAALQAFGGTAKWTGFARGNPDVDPELRRLEREYVGLSDPDELAAQWSQMKALGTKRKTAYLERARRSWARAREVQANTANRMHPKGRADEVPVTLKSSESPGATYCLFVPPSYDPFTPTPLIIGLHGGGRGGKDSTLVSGSGESAMDWYEREASRLGFLVACPSALQAGWGSKANEPLVSNLVEEMALLFNVDRNRIYVAGHSMGGIGSWIWGEKRKDLWAACSPNAGFGSTGGAIAKAGVPLFIYHGADDRIVGVGRDRTQAKALVDNKKADFVYTELNGVGHGWPDKVRKEMFRFFQGRWRGKGRKRATTPRSSFDQKVTRDEVKTFGDPSKAPVEEGRGSKLKPLIDALKKGGGNGADAVVELSKLKDASSAKAVAKLLRSKKSTADTRVLAARALGGMAVPEAVKPLAAAISDEDFRVLDEATEALGRCGQPAAVPPLAKAAKKMSENLENSFLGGNRMTHTEYGVRLNSFGLLCEAYGALGDAKAALPVIEARVIKGVFLREPRIDTGNDPRFVRIPPQERRKLVQRLCDSLVKLGDGAAVPMLEAVATAWKDEPALGHLISDAVGRLR